MSEPPASSSPDTHPASPLAATPPPQRRRGCLRRALFLGCGTLLCCCLLVFWVAHEALKTVISVTDLTTDKSHRAWLVKQGWPASLHRIFEAEIGSNFNGDGTTINIHSFALQDLPRVQALIGRGRTWRPGFDWCAAEMHTFKDRLPADLYFDETAPKDHYQYIEGPQGSQIIHVIDIVRGIHYEFIFRT